MGAFQPSEVRRRMCCFCVPARVGTLGLSTLSILISTTIALQATYALFQDNFVNYFLVWVGTLQCVLWWSLVVVCVYGWLGTVRQVYPWVHWYYELLWWHLWINVVLGIWGLVVFSLPEAKAYRAAVCTSLSYSSIVEETQLQGVLTDQQTKEIVADCINLVKKHLLLVDCAYVLGLLTQLWLTLMVAHYLDELADFDAATQFGIDIESETPPYNELDRFESNRDKTG